MKCLIRWKDMSEQPQTKQYFENKIKKISDFSFIENEVKAEYVYYQRENKYKLKINILIHKGESLLSEAESFDIKDATNQAIDKLIDQLRKKKTQLFKKN